MDRRLDDLACSCWDFNPTTKRLLYVRRLAPKVLNAKTSALRPRITPYPEGYLDNARISEPELHPKYINLGVGPP